MCFQFGGQAPGSSEEERQWAFRKFGFDFDVFDKIDVNGPSAHPIYQFLRQQQPVSAPGAARPVPGGGPGAIEWNYVKVLVAFNHLGVGHYNCMKALAGSFCASAASHLFSQHG